MSLNGTLPPIGPATFEESAQAQEQEILKAVLAQAAAAQQQATQAGSAFSQAAQAPAPTLSPMATFLPSLLGNVASIIGQQPAYREEAQQSLGQKQKELLTRRSEHLKALEAQYESRADAARQLGNKAAELEAQVKRDQVLRQHQQVLKSQEQQAQAERDRLLEEGRNNRAAAQNQTTLNAARLRKSTDASSPEAQADFANFAEQLAQGTIKMQNVPMDKRSGVLAHMKANKQKIIPDAARKAIDELGSASRALDELEALSVQLNTLQDPGPFGINRGIQGAKLGIGAATQTNPDAANFEAARGGLSGNFARAIASERGVLTDQDRAWAMKLLPALSDTQEVAASKIARIRRFIAGKRESAIKNYSTDDPSYVKDPGPINPLVESSRLISALGDRKVKWDKSMEDALAALLEENPELDADPAVERRIRVARQKTGR